MRNDARASAAAESGESGRNDSGTSTPAARPQDPMLAFESEADLVLQPNVVLAAPPSAAPLTPTPPIASAPVAVVPATRHIPWKQIVVAVIAAVAVIQTTLIAAWWWSGRATPDTGSLMVTSDPAGAAVSIDSTTLGTTPYSIVLAAGIHQLAIGSGAQTRTQSITVGRGGEMSVHASLAPEPPVQSLASAVTTGALQISTEPSGARVAVDGQSHGSAPISIDALSAGPHEITIAGADGVVTRRVTVQPGITTSLIVSLHSSGAGSSGWLAVTSGVPAQIFENGTLVGSTDTPRIMLPSGRHDLVISSESLGYSVSHSVQIGAGQTVSLQLETPRGTLNINALPWANVWVDGQSVGETPIGGLSLPIGTHEVVFRHPEFGEQRRAVAVGVTGVARVGIDFRK